MPRPGRVGGDAERGGHAEEKNEPGSSSMEFASASAARPVIPKKKMKARERSSIGKRVLASMLYERGYGTMRSPSV